MILIGLIIYKGLIQFSQTPIPWLYNYIKSLTLLTIYFASLPTPRNVAEENERCPGKPT